MNTTPIANQNIKISITAKNAKTNSTSIFLGLVSILAGKVIAN